MMSVATEPPRCVCSSARPPSKRPTRSVIGGGSSPGSRTRVRLPRRQPELDVGPIDDGAALMANYDQAMFEIGAHRVSYGELLAPTPELSLRDRRVGHNRLRRRPAARVVERAAGRLDATDAGTDLDLELALGIRRVGPELGRVIGGIARVLVVPG